MEVHHIVVVVEGGNRGDKDEDCSDRDQKKDVDDEDVSFEEPALPGQEVGQVGTQAVA